MNFQSKMSARFREELRDWATDNKRFVIKILDIIADIERSPYMGIGKPEPLKHELEGLWSRRIDQEHRLIYAVNETDEEILLVSCYGHYNK